MSAEERKGAGAVFMCILVSAPVYTTRPTTHSVLRSWLPRSSMLSLFNGILRGPYRLELTSSVPLKGGARAAFGEREHSGTPHHTTKLALPEFVQAVVGQVTSDIADHAAQAP